MGSSRMDGRFFATKTTRFQSKPGGNGGGGGVPLLRLLVGLVIVMMVGAVEGQNLNENSPQPTTLNSNPSPITTTTSTPGTPGQVIISNNVGISGTPTEQLASNNSANSTTGQLASNNSESSTTTQLPISDNSNSSTAGTTTTPATLVSSSSDSTSGTTTTPQLANNNGNNSTVETTPGQPVSSSNTNNSDTSTVPQTTQATQTVAATTVDPGQALYTTCQMKTGGIVCFGDKRDCIHSSSCTFLGAISENDSFINVQLLTRTYSPPYHGVNLTVELSREKKGNDSVIRCSRPRFKSFKIRLTWANMTSYEPGNETKLSNTLIDKNQLKADCLADQEKSNFTIPPSKTLALKFYIENKNDNSSTLVSQGLSQVSVQEPTVQSSNVSNNGADRSGRNLDQPPVPSKEDTLYQLCLNNTAKCFGDRAGCTDGRNCSFLGVIQETPSNYHVYVVTKAYPSVDQVLTLTLNTPTPTDKNNSSSVNSTMDNAMSGGQGNSSDSSSSHVDCTRPDIKDLSVQSTWKYNKLPLALLTQLTNSSASILETTVDKNEIKNNCETYLNHNNNSGNSTIDGNIMMDDPSLFLKFHLENGTLVPLGFSSDSADNSGTNETGTFEIGLNGTAYLVSDNKGVVMMAPADDPNSAPASQNSSPSLQTNFMSYLILCLSTSIAICLM